MQFHFDEEGPALRELLLTLLRSRLEATPCPDERDCT